MTTTYPPIGGQDVEPTPVESNLGEPGLIEIAIPHELALQLAGLDGGVQPSVGLQSCMGVGATAAVVAEVAALMQPFLLEEKQRVHKPNRGRWVEPAKVAATREQAAALKALCLLYADHLRCAEQQIDQTQDVIRQINEATDTPHDDGRELAEVAYHLEKRLWSVLAEMATFAKRAEAAWHADEPIGQREHHLVVLQSRLEACLKSNQTG